MSRRTLFLVRHAKSSWTHTALTDFDRPLNERGLKDAARMAKRLKEKEITPDCMITSPAQRTLTTCEIFSSILGFLPGAIKKDRSLYHADDETLLSAVQKFDDRYRKVLLFGHNPGITEFANHLFEIFIDNIPTTGIVAGEFNVDQWSEVTFKGGKFLFFDFPKRTIAE